MALMPGVTHLLMPYSNSLPLRSGPTTVVLHTNGGGSELYGWFARAGNTICSHFQVFKDGRIQQYLDTARVGYAQWDANAFGISIETEDDGDPSTPWTAAQVAAIQKIIRWTGVPHQLAPAGGGGIGWHEQHSSWNQSGHACPGSVREHQITSVIIPGLSTPTPTHVQTLEEWMASNEDKVQAMINSAVANALRPIVSRINEIPSADEIKENVIKALKNRSENGSMGADFWEGAIKALNAAGSNRELNGLANGILGFANDEGYANRTKGLRIGTDPDHQWPDPDPAKK